MTKNYKIIKYPDGSSYAKLYQDSPEYFTFKINTYEDLWHLNQLVDAYNTIGKRPNIFIPNLIDAQADRRFNKDESSGLKLVCQFLNNLNADFEIFHPHNPEVVEALIDNVVITDNYNFIAKELCKLEEENLVLMSSDAGGFKPLSKLCNKLNWKGDMVSASKSREYKNEESKLTQILPDFDFTGRNVMIIDDICVYGGTFKGLSKLLKDRGANNLYLAVSHMTMENTDVADYFTHIFTTDSKYDTYYNQDGFEIRNLTVSKLNYE